MPNDCLPKVVPNCPYTGVNIGLIRTPAQHQNPFADALSYCDDVGPDAAKLMGKESSGAAVSALNLIQNQDCSVEVQCSRSACT